MIVMVTFAASILWIYYSEIQDFQRHAEEDTSIKMEIIQKALEEQLVTGMPLERVQALIDAIATEERIKTIYITDKEGMVKLSTDRSFANFRFEKEKEEGCIVCHENGAVSYEVTLVSAVDHSGERILRSVSPIENKKACQACHSPDKRYLGMIIVDTPVSHIIGHINDLQRGLAATLLAALSAATIFVYGFVAIFVKRPLHGLLGTIKAIGGGNLRARADIRGRDEFSILGASVNEMAGSLEKQIEEIRAKGYEIRVLKALNEIISAASKSLALEDVLEPTLKVIIRSLEILEEAGGRKVKITGGIFLIDEERRELRLSALHGISPESLGCQGKVAVGDCICGLAVQSGEVNAVPYCLADPRHTRMPLVRPEEDHAHVSIPLKSGDRVLGSIFLYFSPPGYQSSPSDIATFTSIGSYLGLHVEKARLHEKILELSTHDSLTGLCNRREFERWLKEEAERSRRFGRPFALLMLDIDHFKVVNDTYGHPAGDEALRAVAALLSGEVRSVDTVARYGGEEFAILMPETGGSGGLTMAERIRVSIASQAITVAQGQAVNLTVSIGVAAFPEAAGSEKELVAAADGALYAAKSAGRNRVEVAPGLNNNEARHEGK